MRATAPALTIAAFAVACGGPNPEAGTFGVGSGPGGMVESTGAPTPGTSTAAGSSSGAGPEDSSTSSSTATGESSTTELLRDVGGADLGSGQPAGCKGKIDFLFVISSFWLMDELQVRLIDAFPKFIETIASKFADFDVHIMVVDGDGSWGIPSCTSDCPVLDCKVGQPCCPVSIGCTGDDCVYPGDPCCDIDDYPCGLVDQVTACDETMGAGIVFPAGDGATNAPCDIAGGRRYLTHEEPDLAGTFACVAQLGTAGDDTLAAAMTAALSPELNGPGGCNEGFLRDDALLMVTFIYNTADTHSAGKPKLWAEAALAAKHGDPNAIVMFSIARPDCTPWDRVCDMVMYYFPYWYIAEKDDADYGPAFDIATDRVTEACSAFIPQ